MVSTLIKQHISIIARCLSTESYHLRLETSRIISSRGIIKHNSPVLSSLHDLCSILLCGGVLGLTGWSDCGGKADVTATPSSS